jgi:hypothetical protein
MGFTADSAHIKHENEKRVPAKSWNPYILGADGRNRTRDPLITSQVLYQLSYIG